MTGKQFADLVRFNTRTTSTTFSDADLVNIANNKMVYLAKKIEGVDEDYFGSPETKDLVASSTSREYPLPSDNMSRIKKVEAKFDGTNWIVLKELDLNQFDRTTDETTIINNFSNDYGHCFFDLFRNSLWLYSGTISAVDDGLKLWSYAYPTDLQASDLIDEARDLSDPATDDDNGMPKLFHELWADLVSIHFKSVKEKPIPLTQQEANWRNTLKELLIDLKGANRDRDYSSGAPDVSKWGDSGFNY